MSPRTIHRAALGAICAVGCSVAAAAQSTTVGLSAVRSRRIAAEASPPYLPLAGDGFASALAVGDFDGDGVDDLATGIPFADADLDGPEGALENAGVVAIRRGVAGQGVDAQIAAILQQSAPVDPAEADDLFGFALAACDFDGDGRDELTIGAPREDVGLSANGAGAIWVRSGLGSPTLDRFVTQATPGIPDEAEDGDQFGHTLACGDFDADGFDDLAVGVPIEDLSAICCVGQVAVIPGSAAGLVPEESYVLDQNSPGVVDAPEEGDVFGYTLASADFDGDGFEDLAIASPGEGDSVVGFEFGLVHVLYGAAGGLSGSGSQVLTDDLVGGEREAGDAFGFALASADFDADGFDDLAIGVPFEDLGAGNAIEGAGRVVVAYGSASGLEIASAQLWTQDNLVGVGTSELFDQFGSSLSAGDFDADGFDDLAAGSPGEFVLVPGDGTVVVWMGSSVGLGAARRRGFAVGFDGLPGAPNQIGRNFGLTLGSGDFDADGHADLAVGAPKEDENAALVDVGSVTVLYGSLFADGFGTGNAALWSSAAANAGGSGAPPSCDSPGRSKP